MPAAAAQNAYLKYGIAYTQDPPSHTRETLASRTRWQWSVQLNKMLASEMARHPKTPVCRRHHVGSLQRRPAH